MSARALEIPQLPPIRVKKEHVITATTGLTTISILGFIVFGEIFDSGEIPEIPPLTASADPELVQYYLNAFSCEELAAEISDLIDQRQLFVIQRDLKGADVSDDIAEHDKFIASALQAYNKKCYTH